MENKSERQLFAPPLTKEEKLRFVLNRLMELCDNYSISESKDGIRVEAEFIRKKEP